MRFDDDDEVPGLSPPPRWIVIISAGITMFLIGLLIFYLNH